MLLRRSGGFRLRVAERRHWNSIRNACRLCACVSNSSQNKHVSHFTRLRLSKAIRRISFGTWIFKTKECFWLLDDLKALFKSQGVNFVSVPLYDAVQVCLEPKTAEALERKLHLDVYNIAEPGTRR